MGQQDIMSYHVRFSWGVASGAVFDSKWRRTSKRCHSPHVITSSAEHISLVHSTPIQNPVSKLSETHICICREVFPALPHVLTYIGRWCLITQSIILKKGWELIPVSKHTQSCDSPNHRTRPQVPVEDRYGVMLHVVGFLLIISKAQWKCMALSTGWGTIKYKTFIYRDN